MPFDVRDGLLGDAPDLTLLQQGESTALLGAERDPQPAALGDPLQELLEGRGHVLHFGDVGAEVVQGVPDLADDAAHVIAEVVE